MTQLTFKLERSTPLLPSAGPLGSRRCCLGTPGLPIGSVRRPLLPPFSSYEAGEIARPFALELVVGKGVGSREECWGGREAAASGSRRPS